jgi:hypothetical protein
MRFRLKAVKGQPHAIFPDKEPQRAYLLSRFLVPDPYYITILIWEIIRVQKKKVDWWVIDNKKLRITCTFEGLVIEEGEGNTQGDSARVELTLKDAEELLSNWRFRHLAWEFKQVYKRAKKELEMKVNMSKEKAGLERPILFRVSGPFGRHLCFARGLVDAVRIADRNRRRAERHSSFSISAVYQDGSEDVLLPEQYIRNKEVTKEDAIRYIRRRDEGIKTRRIWELAK